MGCRKCGGNDVNIQVVSETRTKKKGLIYWLCFIWLLDLATWILMFGFRFIIRIIRGKKIETKFYKMAICQSCGKSWRV